MKTRTPLFLALALLVSSYAHAQNILDNLGLGKSTSGVSSALPAGLSQDDIAGGLKDALSKGVQSAVGMLGRQDGFLKDAAVKIPLPASMQKVESTLRTLGQGKLVDEFITTMNRAAEQAVPVAASVLADSVKQMSIADAQAILTGTNDAATQYFRRTSETNLYVLFLPIVKKATAQTGVTGAYNNMTAKVSGGFGSFGSFGSFGGNALAGKMPDINAYVTQKALDGLFVKIAAMETSIRSNPLARTTDLMQKVFGAVGK